MTFEDNPIPWKYEGNPIPKKNLPVDNPMTIFPTPPAPLPLESSIDDILELEPSIDEILELDPYPIYDSSFKNGSSWIRQNILPLCYGGFITTCLVTGLILSNTISNAIDTPGAKGDQGIVGIQGDSGLNGKTGLQGDIGIAGLNGEQGETGAPGLNGIQGEVGAIGLTGATGLNGAKGEVGVAGLNGVNGSAGANGANGSNGADGASSLFLKTKITASDPLIKTGGTVIQLSLPAGTYLLVWTGIVKGNDVNGGEIVNCGIEDASTGFARGVMLTDLQGVVQRTSIAQQASLTLDAAGNVSVFCNTVFRDSSAVISHQTFSAQKLSTVTIQ